MNLRFGWFCIFFLIASCAGTADVRDLGFWALGWQFTPVQNRLQPAIPPVLTYLRERYPGVRTAEVPRSFERDFQDAILKAPADMQDRLTRRMVGAFAVSGMPCAAEGYPVQAEGWSVAAFIVLDLDKLAGPPGDWMPCPPIPPGEIGERVPAMRGLIATLVDRQAPKRISPGP